MIGKTKAIKNELKTVLDGIMYQPDQATPAAKLFTAVIDDFSGAFENYPAARIIPQDTPAEIATNVENDRTVVLTVATYVSFESDDRTEAEAIDLCYDIQDIVTDAIDQHDWTSVTNNLVEAAGVRWLVAEGSTGSQISLEFDVRITYSKDV